jgi:hypothetical protein
VGFHKFQFPADGEHRTLIQNVVTMLNRTLGLARSEEFRNAFDWFRHPIWISWDFDAASAMEGNDTATPVRRQFSGTTRQRQEGSDSPVQTALPPRMDRDFPPVRGVADLNILWARYRWRR